MNNILGQLHCCLLSISWVIVIRCQWTSDCSQFWHFLKRPITNHHSIMTKTMIRNHRSVVSFFPRNMLLLNRKWKFEGVPCHKQDLILATVDWLRGNFFSSHVFLFALITSRKWFLDGQRICPHFLWSGWRGFWRIMVTSTSLLQILTQSPATKKSWLARKVGENGPIRGQIWWKADPDWLEKEENDHKSVLSRPPLLPPHPFVSPALLAFLKHKMSL